MFDDTKPEFKAPLARQKQFETPNSSGFSSTSGSTFKVPSTDSVLKIQKMFDSNRQPTPSSTKLIIPNQLKTDALSRIASVFEDDHLQTPVTKKFKGLNPNKIKLNIVKPASQQKPFKAPQRKIIAPKSALDTVSKSAVIAKIATLPDVANPKILTLSDVRDLKVAPILENMYIFNNLGRMKF